MRRVLIALSAAAALIGCGQLQDILDPSGGSDSVKIGFIVSGERDEYVNGAQLAAAEINHNGGLLGRRVELTVQTRLDTAEAAVEAAARMIQEEGVVALIGPNRSAHAAPAGELAQRHRVPMIATTATNPNVTNAGGFVFMAAFTDAFQGGAMAQFARETLNIGSAAVITRRGDLYTEGVSEFFADHFRALGGEIAAHAFHEPDALDFTEPLNAVAEAKPDALFIAGFIDDIARVTQQAREMQIQNAQGEPTVFLGADSWDNEKLFNDKNAEIEGSYFSGHFSADTDEPSARAFVEAYEAAYGEKPIGGVAVSYDAVKLLAEAVERAGSFDPVKVRDQIAAAENYMGGTIIARYNENRHPTKSAVVFTIRGGEKAFLKQINP